MWYHCKSALQHVGTHSDTCTQFSTLIEMPLDNHLLAEKPGAGGAPPGGASLERLANKDQVNATEDGGTLDCARDKVWQACTGWGPGDRAPG